MSLEKTAREQRYRDRAMELSVDRDDSVEPDILDVIRQKIVDADFLCWWGNPSLLMIGLVECRTFGRGRFIREWLDE